MQFAMANIMEKAIPHSKHNSSVYDASRGLLEHMFDEYYVKREPLTLEQVKNITLENNYVFPRYTGTFHLHRHLESAIAEKEEKLENK